MIVEFTKIPEGLRWNDQDRFFTYSIFPDGYEIQGTDICQIELDNQSFMLCSNDSKVDNFLFNDIEDELKYIYL